jgi:hypothetical protein
LKVNPPDKTIMAAETNFQRPLEAKVSDNSVSNRKTRKCTNNRGKVKKEKTYLQLLLQNVQKRIAGEGLWKNGKGER